MKIDLKNSKGITLILLIVTIIVMIIIASITINVGLSSINSTQDSVIESSLKVVQQAIGQKYAEAKTLNNIDKSTSTTNFIDEKPSSFIGTPLTQEELLEKLQKYKSGDEVLVLLNQNNSNETYDNIYYYLNSNDLKTLGIDSADDQQYIVNYETGEVWDISNVTYESGEYAYINGLSEVLEIEQEEFVDSPINISLVSNLIQSSSNSYGFTIKVTDDIAKITPDGLDSNKIDTISSKDYNDAVGKDKDDFNKSDIKDGNIIIKIGEEEKKWSEIENNIIITKRVNKDENQQIGEYYIYEIVIKNIISDTNSSVTLIINPGTIIDDSEHTNAITEISTACDQIDISNVNFNFELGAPKFFCIDEDGEYIEKEVTVGGDKWGASASVDLILSTNDKKGLKAQSYTFSYVWTTDSDFEWKSGDAKQVSINTRQGVSSAKATIYLDSYSGKGKLYVRPTQSNYQTTSGKVLDGTPKSVTVNLDSTPAKLNLYCQAKNGEYEIIDNYLKQDNVYFAFGEEKSDGYYKLSPNIVMEIIDDDSGIIVDHGSDTNYPMTRFYYRVHYDINKFKDYDVENPYRGNKGDSPTIFENNYPRYMREDITLHKMDYGYDNSGEYYIYAFRDADNYDSLSKYYIDNVGNTLSEGIIKGPIKLDLYSPEISKITISEEGTAKFRITDDYSGLSNNYSKIKYAWVNNNNLKKEEITTWKSITESQIEDRISTDNDSQIMELSVNVGSPTEYGDWYLAVTIDDFEDVAGNKVSDSLKFSDETISLSNDLGINISEPGEIGYPTNVEIEIYSKDNKPFSITKVWYEHDGLNDANKLLKTAENRKDAYKISINSTVNGPITVYVQDNFGKIYSAKYTIEKVQETILTYDLNSDDENPILMLPIWQDIPDINKNYKPSKEVFLHIKWGDGKEEYILNPAFYLEEEEELFTVKHKGFINDNKLNVPIHQYNENNEFQISISGDLDGLWKYKLNTCNFLNTEQMVYNCFEDSEKIKTLFEYSRESLTKINQFGIHGTFSGEAVDDFYMNYWYNECINLEDVQSNDSNKNALERVSNMNSAFKETKISNFNWKDFSKAKNLTSLESTFYETNISDIAEDAFFACINLENLSSTFYGCARITEIPEKLFSNNVKVYNFSKTFCGTSIIEIPENLFEQNGNVKYFEATFKDCKSLSVEVKKIFRNCPLVLSFDECFSGTSNLKIVDPGIFDTNKGNPNNVGKEDTRSILYGFQSVFYNSGLEWDTVEEAFKYKDLFRYSESCQSFRYTFAGCTNIKFIDKDLFHNNTKVKNFSSVFSGTSISNIDKSIFDSSKNVLEILTGAFSNCENLSIEENEYWFKGYYKLSSLSSMFSDCSNIKKIPKGIFATVGNNYYGSVSFQTTFSGSGIEKVESNIWGNGEDTIDKNKNYNFVDMFASCQNLLSVDDIFKNFSKVTEFISVFENCRNLKNVNKEIFVGCNKVKSLEGCFFGCSSLNQLDENMFDSMKGTLTKISNNIDYNGGKRYQGIFQGCSSLETCPKIWEWSQFKNKPITENSYNAFLGIRNETLKNNIKSCGLENWYNKNYDT